MIRGVKFCRVLPKTDLFYGVKDTKIPQIGKRQRQQALSNMKPWVVVFLQNHGTIARFREQCSGRGAGGSTADDDDVVVMREGFHVHVHGRIDPSVDSFVLREILHEGCIVSAAFPVNHDHPSCRFVGISA